MVTTIDILNANGFSNSDSIVRAAHDAGLPLGIAAALMAQESMGANVYGHDSGGYRPADYVTEDNFREFYQAVVVNGATSNGVGPSQITYPGYFSQQPDYAWWDPYSNMCFGFRLMVSYLGGRYGDDSLIAGGSRYNSGSPTGNLNYGRSFNNFANQYTALLSTTEEDDMDANQAQLLQEIHDRVMAGLPNGPEGQNGTKILDSADGGTIMDAIGRVPDNIFNRTITRKDGHTATFDDMIGYLDLRLEVLDKALRQYGIPQAGLGKGNNTDIVTETAWLPDNFARIRNAIASLATSIASIQATLNTMEGTKND